MDYMSSSYICFILVYIEVIYRVSSKCIYQLYSLLEFDRVVRGTLGPILDLACAS